METTETAETVVSETQIGIGTVLEFDETEFSDLKYRWHKYLIPAINALAAEWELLEMGEFTQSVFKELQDGCNNVEEQYISRMEKELKKSKLGFVLNRNFLISSVSERLSGLRAAADNLKKALKDASYNGARRDKPIDFVQIEIIDGKPELDEEKLRALCSITISTESQLEAWNAFLIVQKYWNIGVEILIKNGFDIDRANVMADRHFRNGFVSELPDGKLQLDPLALALIR